MTVDAKSSRLPRHLAEALDLLADRYGKPAEELLATAVERFLDEEHAFVAKISEAMARADAGETVPWEEAEKGFRDMIARAKAFHEAV